MDVAARPTVTTPTGRYLTIGLLAVAMAVALFPVISVGVLSTFLLADLGISRTQLGFVVTVAAATSALAGLALGRIVDRYGGRASLLTVFVLSGVAIIGIAVAPTYLLVVGVAGLAGISLGIANSATNRVVAETIPPGRWGTVTGVKQAGETLMIVACGALLPVAALAFGWRWAMVVAAVVPAAATVLVMVSIPAQPRKQATTPTGRRRRALSRDVFWLAAFTICSGLAGGSVSTYLPLYAQESLRMSTPAAGLVVALMGIVATIGRVTWGHLARNSRDLRSRFRTISLLAVGAILLVWAASRIHPDLVWLGAVVWGISVLSAGALGMLAVITYAGLEDAGRASGVIHAAFGLGLMIGPPIFGWTVDATGAYDAGLAIVLLELASGTVIAFIWGRRARQPRAWEAGAGQPRDTRHTG